MIGSQPRQRFVEHAQRKRFVPPMRTFVITKSQCNISVHTAHRAHGTRDGVAGDGVNGVG